MWFHWWPWLILTLVCALLGLLVHRCLGWGKRKGIMRACVATLLLASLACLSLTGCSLWWHNRSVPPPRDGELFPGVRYLREIETSPRSNVFHVAFVDLTKPGLSSVVSKPDPAIEPELRAQTTEEFLRSTGSSLAINANFFQPFSSKSPVDYYPKSGDPVHVLGIAAAEGNLYGTQIWRNATLHLSRHNQATLGDLPANLWNAIAGDQWLIRDGQPVPPISAHSTNLHPRTAVGLTRDSKTLLLVLVDGRQPNYSEGVTLSELTQAMLRHRAHNAINLDGGGSATMVALGSDGQPKTLNSPIHTRIPGRQRPVANHLGIKVGLAE